MKRSDPEEDELSSPDPHFAGGTTTKRKRNRVCLSCSVCRRRKVKCDRGKPCKRCASLGLSDQCTYQSPNWINSKSVELPTDVKSIPAAVGSATMAPNSKNADDKHGNGDTVRKLGSNHKSKTPPDSELHNELHLLREKLSMIENTLKTGKGNNNLRQRNSEQLSDRNTPILDLSGTPSGGYASLSPSKNYRLPRTSISSLMNPLPVSGTRYSYAPITNNEYSSESYLFHLGIDERERLEFSTANTCTLLMDETSSSYTSFGPLSNFAILLQDNHLSTIREQVMELRRKFNRKSADFPDNAGARLFDNDSPALKYNKEDKSAATIIIDDSELNDAILNVLPKANDLKMLVDRYFKFVYPFLPILTKSKFEDDIKRILKVSSFDDANVVKELNIRNNLDYAILGSLLVVLKFGHSTMISNKQSNTFLPDSGFKSNVINVSHLCLRKFALFTQASLEILQHGLLYRSFHAIQGLEKLNDNVPFIFNNLLVQMAIGIGLNRDPKKFKQQRLVSPQLENRWRFLWQVVSHLDLTAFLTSGSHRVIRKEYCDTLTPYLVDQSLGLARDQLELENVIVKMMKIRSEFDELLFKVTDCICRLSPTPTAGELFGAIDNLETVISLRLGPLQILLATKAKEETEQEGEEDTHIKNVEKVFQIAMYINSLAAIIPVMCHLILLGEKKQNFTACRYFIARLIIIIMKIIVGYKQITTSSTNLFGEGFDWFVSSNYSSLMHKALVGILVCFFRVAISRNNFKDSDPVKFGLLNTLLFNLFGFRVWNEYLPHAKNISSTRFYAWGLLKFHAFIQTLTEKARNCENIKSEEYNVFDQMSVSDIQAFIELSNIDTYSNDSDESMLRIKTILENLKNGVSFKDSYTNKSWISLNEDNPTDLMEINKEYLPNEYEDKYWSELMLRDAYAFDDKKIEDLFDATQMNSIDSIYNNYYGLRS